MARTLGELFPIIVAILGIYFLLAAMFSPTVVTHHDLIRQGGPVDELAVLAVEEAGEDRLRVELLVGVNPAPGLYAIASALCFGSVLLWSRLTPTPARFVEEAA